MAGTTPKARAIGAELRKAREAAGFTLRRLAVELGTSHASVSRWETGARTPRPHDVAAYLARVGAGAEIREELVELAQDPDGSHWLSVGMPDQQRQVATLLEIEREAKQLTTVSPLLIPGLLQTGDYARAIMTTGGVPADEIDVRVAVRIGRRESITRREPARLLAYIGESALRQVIGSSAIMVDQLASLVQFGEQDNVEIRVVPLRTDWHPGLEGLFSIAAFSDGRDPVVHLENRISGLFLHEAAEVSAYQDALGRMEEVAMSPTESAEFIVGVRDEMEAKV